MNIVILTGNLTRDPEMRYTATGTAVASFTIAVPRRFKRDEVDFINCVAWQKTAEFVAQYFTKGQGIEVEGRLQVRKYENKEGKKRDITEVVVEQVGFRGKKEPKEQNDWDKYGTEVELTDTEIDF